MILDAIFWPILTLLEALIGALPTGTISIPAVDAILMHLARINSIIPISGPLTAAVSMLGLLVVWVAIRIAIMLWQQLPFT